MPACKSVSKILIALLVSVSLYAQGSSVFDMSMPTVTSPTLGSGFYVPGNSSNSIYTGPSAKGSAVKSTKAADVSSSEATQTASTDDSYASVSASDISLLSQKGLLGQLGSIFEDRSSYSYDSTSLYKVNATDETNKLLKKVLSRLEEIKVDSSAAKTVSAGKAESSSSGNAGAEIASSQNGTYSGAKSNLLRFTVNGYDVLKTCRTVYISDVQKDGTFLITGDRRYNANGKMLNETFHILFKAKPDSADCVNYASAVAVTQEVSNPNSFLYQLAQRKGMEASRTGNFVTMRTADPDWKLELLVDLGE